MADRGAAADAPEQPRPGGRRAPGEARRLRGHRQGGAQSRRAASDRQDAPAPGGRRDAPRAERQARRGLPDDGVGAESPDRELAAGAALGQLGRVPAPRGRGPDDVRADDRGQLDLHRHAGDPPGHVPDVRGRGRGALRISRPRRPHDPHGGARRDGRRAAARCDDGGRRRALHRGRPEPHRAPARDAVPRCRERVARRRARAGPGRGGGATAAVRRAPRERGRRRPRARAPRGALRPRHRPDRGARPAHGLRTSGPRRGSGRGASPTRPGGVPAQSPGVDCRARARAARPRQGGKPRVRLRQQPAWGGAGGGSRRRLLLSGLRPGVHPAALLPGDRPLQMGRVVR